MDEGCSRCSDGIALVVGQQVRANVPRHIESKAWHVHLRMRGAGSVDDERAEAEAAFKWAL